VYSLEVFRLFLWNEASQHIYWIDSLHGGSLNVYSPESGGVTSAAGGGSTSEASRKVRD